MKKLFTGMVLLFAALAAFAQKNKTVTITGNITGDTKGYDNIYFYTASVPKDSVAIKNGKFVVKIPFTETFTQLFYTQYETRSRGSYRPFPVLIDGSGNIKIEMDIEKGFHQSVMSGSKTAVLFHSFLKQQTDTYGKINTELIKLYGKGYVPVKDPVYEKLMVSRDSLSKLYMGTLVTDFTNQHKDLYVGVYVLNMSGKSALDIDQLENTLKSLSPKMQKTSEGEKLAAYIRGVKNTKIGVTIRNFVLNDPDGKAISFEQFKGKYVWIDFWASWCGPCKQAFPHMKQLYAQYKDKGFEIVGISTDSKIDPWLNILPKLQNPWPQLWDNKNIMSEFAVTAFPTSFLIDPDGKIVLKEVGYEPNGGSEMDKKLVELFGGKISSSDDKSIRKDSVGKTIIPAVQMKAISSGN